MDVNLNNSLYNLEIGLMKSKAYSNFEEYIDTVLDSIDNNGIFPTWTKLDSLRRHLTQNNPGSTLKERKLILSSQLYLADIARPHLSYDEAIITDKVYPLFGVNFVNKDLSIPSPIKAYSYTPDPRMGVFFEPNVHIELLKRYQENKKISISLEAENLVRLIF